MQSRGAAILKARKLSSAMSAAKAIVDHMRDWWNGTPQVITDTKLYLVPVLGAKYKIWLPKLSKFHQLANCFGLFVCTIRIDHD